MRALKCLLAVLVALPALAQAAGGTELTWFGHSAFRLITPSGKVILIDPWLTNPANKNGKEDLARLDKVDLILITHGHLDHVGNGVEIATRTGARLVSTFDLGKALVKYGGYPEKQMGSDTQGNFGGELQLLEGELSIGFVPAVHSSTVTEPEGSARKDIHDGGNPGGFVISVRDGPSIYHTGDTDVFGDMALVGKFNQIDVMLACIGGHFTMGPKRAAEAVKLVRPARVVPMHFGTFPVLSGTVEQFAEALKRANVQTQLKELKIGETLAF